MDDQDVSAGDQADGIADGVTATERRTVLALGAIAASTVVTIRPALAQTAGSVMNCQIPVPAPEAGAQYIAADGSLVAPGTPGSFAPAPRPITGEEAKALIMRGQTPAGLESGQAQAYANYIRRLQAGMSGFTCYASLQMPRQLRVSGQVYAADPPSARAAVMLDGLVAVFHEPSGATHLLAPPAPEILDALEADVTDITELLGRLAARHVFDPDDAQPLLDARLAELEASGLIRRL